MGSDPFYSCWVFWQDDVKATSKGLPSYKPPPPPPPLAQGRDHPLTQARKPGREDLQPPSSASSHSGIVFSAPRNRSPPAGTAPTQEASSAQDSPPSPIYASVSPANPGSKRPLDAHLALVNQHPIGPFPRVQSPPHLKSPPAEALLLTGGAPPPPSPSGRPDQTGTNQHFVMVEVHRPDSEPDVNEVRALPQTRSEYHTPWAWWALRPLCPLRGPVWGRSAKVGPGAHPARGLPAQAFPPRAKGPRGQGPEPTGGGHAGRDRDVHPSSAFTGCVTVDRLPSFPTRDWR